jgi:F-type H+-transporting ATPase subunit gamma
MASLKEIRTRISSVKSTKQVTSAMKMVSAAKLRKAQDAIVQMRPYAEKLHGILTNLSSSLDSSEDNPYAEARTPNKVLLVVITSNRGLCGAFNANVVKRAETLLNGTYKEQNAKGDVSVITVGKKANDLFKARNVAVAEEHNELFNALTFENVSVLASKVMQEFVEGKYDRVELVYNQFKNAGTQILTNESFLPVEVSEEEGDFQFDYIFEPSKEYIVNELIPLSLKTQFYKAILDSHAAEHGARMTAMHQATDNASDLLKELQLSYNKARQASITNEILEIVGGAEALQG